MSILILIVSCISCRGTDRQTIMASPEGSFLSLYNNNNEDQENYRERRDLPVCKLLRVVEYDSYYWQKNNIKKYLFQQKHIRANCKVL